ncbi:MAG: hypothetical protein A2622_08025 [Bdellovibrionales bacterium RIFCSPHIGHO2_01_FULL_40_29]|nr:MAG: hypothetical protein A2622_08025 [Bdellovibrionales bacterium RIFCSPHIGHO2_01_FULL_40_29]
MKKQNEAASSQSMNEILNFLEKKAQYKFTFADDILEIKQVEDQKNLKIKKDEIEKVLSRQDLDGSPFLQINFSSGAKILVTHSLIGFKPHEIMGFDATRIPRVVTTVDLKSVSNAIEQLFDSDEAPDSKAEIEVLKKVYQSIMIGAENIGFQMSAEKKWFSSIMLNASAFAA